MPRSTTLNQVRYVAIPLRNLRYPGWVGSNLQWYRGPPYTDRNSAVRDTLASASRLINDGNQVQVPLFDIDGTGSILQPMDDSRFT